MCHLWAKSLFQSKLDKCSFLHFFPLHFFSAAGCTFEEDSDPNLCDFTQGEEDDFDWLLFRTYSSPSASSDLLRGEWSQCSSAEIFISEAIFCRSAAVKSSSNLRNIFLFVPKWQIAGKYLCANQPGWMSRFHYASALMKLPSPVLSASCQPQG